ncbi:MAG: helix-hairpin-helix domain-containing protein [Dictyoglomus sp.]
MFEKKEKIILVIFSVILIGILLSFPIFRNNEDTLSSDEIVSDFIIVHIAGDVKRPGVYRLEEGARVIDAINLAGGPLSSADLDKLNLADFLKDGAKIYVPSKSEENKVNSLIQNKNSLPYQQDSKININTATKEQLESLPGIGPTLAQRIVDYRNENGLFTSLEDLLNVKGIGEKKLEKIKDKVTW